MSALSNHCAHSRSVVRQSLLGSGLGEGRHLQCCNITITAFQQTHLNNVCYFSVMPSLLPEDFPLQFISQ